MQKNKKSNKGNIGNFHEILDDISYKDLPPEDVKYLKSLDKRLKKSSDKTQVYRKIVAKQMGEEEVSLELNITIHLRKVKKQVRFKGLKKEEIIPKIRAPPIVIERLSKKDPFEDEDFLEIEKIEYKGPLSIEVKPKIIVKGEVLEEPSPIEIKDIIAREVKIEVFKHIISIDDETAVLLYNKGFTTVESLENITIPVLVNSIGIPKKLAKKISKELNKLRKGVAKVEPTVKGKSEDEDLTEEMIKEDVLSKSEEEPATVELHEKTSAWETIEDIEHEIFDDHTAEKKAAMKVFKDVKSIDEDTAFLLYTNGFTTLDALTMATNKDLSKIKGIKRKKAVEIKKEIEIEQKAKPFKITVEKSTEATKKGKGVTDYFEEKEGSSFIDVDKKILEQEKPVKIEGDGFFKEKFEEIPSAKEDKAKDIFKDIRSIDGKIAKLLLENGIESVEILKTKTIKDLKKIRGIKRKVAKQIKKEVKRLSVITEANVDTTTFETVEEHFIKEDTDEWESFDVEKIAESDIKELTGFIHGDYTLYEKEIETKTGKTKKVRFFSKAEPEEGEPIDLPKGYEVKEKVKTGLPYLKKKKNKLALN